MNLTLFAIFLAIAIFGKFAASHPVKYDQRQEGDLNVRTDVEDVVFVVVPPPDLVAAGMSLVAATAADFLRKNYGVVGPEKWPMRTSPKLGFVPLEKSPYKIDLEKSGFQVKKISHPGDPNRYNFHEGKNPTKSEISPTEGEVPAKSTTEMIMEMMQSTTENKTVKKDLKQEEIKKEETKEKITIPGIKRETIEASQEKRVMEKKKGTKESSSDEKKILEKKKDEKASADEQKKKENISSGDKKLMEQKKQDKFSEPDGLKSKTEAKPSTLKVVTDDSNPDSIFRLEGCGPDGYRDSEGKCTIRKPDAD